MVYKEALEYMYSQLPMFHRIGKLAYKANLNNALALDEYFNFPHKQYRTIHVAGTNGKGSVSHMLAAVLQTCGYTTGLYTSPHLTDFRERIRVNGEMVDENFVTSFTQENKLFFDEIKPSFFEMTSAMAFEYFKIKKVDIAIIEVGLGGRLDSTNIINPELSIITNIGLDHTDLLGNTLELIATEKAGIIKPSVPVIIGEYTTETKPVFQNKAKNANAPVFYASEIYKATTTTLEANNQTLNVYTLKDQTNINFKLDLKGLYQQKNICTVLTAIDILKQKLSIPEDCVANGLEHAAQLTGLQGRWQTISEKPLTICDTGHNYDGIKWITEQFKNTPHQQLHIVLGFVSDKSIDKILPLFPQQAIYYFCQANIPRALDKEILKKQASLFGLEGNIYNSVSEAFIAAKNSAQAEDLIFIGGSTFVVAEIL
jgi:dihydrofolate synthase / folylpolyglutamate synthase